MLNCILFSLLLAAIGACYVWLGVKKKNLAEHIHDMRLEIETVSRHLEKVEADVGTKLTGDHLRRIAAKPEFRLKPVLSDGSGQVIDLKEPSLPASGGAGTSPVRGAAILAGTQLP